MSSPNEWLLLVKLVSLSIRGTATRVLCFVVIQFCFARSFRPGLSLSVLILFITNITHYYPQLGAVQIGAQQTSSSLQLLHGGWGSGVSLNPPASFNNK